MNLPDDTQGRDPKRPPWTFLLFASPKYEHRDEPPPNPLRKSPTPKPVIKTKTVRPLPIEVVMRLMRRAKD